MRELLKAAMSFQGTAVVDIISPCVTFNNHEESTKSYPYGKEHEERIQDIQFIQAYDEIQIDYEPGTTQLVKMHDGPTIQLKKIEKDYDPTNKWRALALLEESREKQEFITGLLYIREERPTLPQVLHLIQTPLAQLSADQLRPSRETFGQVMNDFR